MAVIGQLQLEVPKTTFKTYLANTRAVSIENGDTLVVIARNFFHIEFLQQRLCLSVLATLEKIHGSPLKVAYQSEGTQHAAGASRSEKNSRAALRKDMTFSTFITGRCNEIPWKAAQSAAKSPKQEERNLLYIYGAPGMGKTHLLHAIGNQLTQNGSRVMYVASEDFITNFVSAVRNNKVRQLQSKYRSAGTLLLDDIDTIAGKIKTEAYFTRVLDEMKALNKQVVLTGELPIGGMGFGKKLATRISEGLALGLESIADDMNTKVALTKHYFQKYDMDVTSEAMGLICATQLSNVSELIGIIKKAKTVCSLNGTPPTLDEIRQIVGDMSKPPSNRGSITASEVVEVVSDITGVSESDILGRGRNSDTTHARWMAMHFMSKSCNLPPHRIGKYMDNRSEQTVIYGEKRLKDLASTEETTRATMSLIAQKVKEKITK